jgi:hypothetical protein
MPRRIEVAGRTIGRATVLGDAPRSRSGRCRVECKCSCGTGFVCDPRLLLNGQTTSCGCRHRESVTLAGALNGTHRMSRTTEYNTWIKIRDRCKNPRNVKFSDYGGRGISVCERWDASFEAFFSDIGPKPHRDWSLDRIDNNGDYEPGNCRWASTSTQARNRRTTRMVEYDGRQMPLVDACQLAGVNYRSAIWRLNRGEQPLPSPPRGGGR